MWPIRTLPKVNCPVKGTEIDKETAQSTSFQECEPTWESWAGSLEPARLVVHNSPSPTRVWLFTLFNVTALLNT